MESWLIVWSSPQHPFHITSDSGTPTEETIRTSSTKSTFGIDDAKLFDFFLLTGLVFRKKVQGWFFQVDIAFNLKLSGKKRDEHEKLLNQWNEILER
jgi:hypothetical protein